MRPLSQLRLIINKRRTDRSPGTPSSVSPANSLTPTEANKDDLFSRPLERRKSMYDTVRELLLNMSQDEDLHDRIKLFALLEHSQENVLLYDAVQKYKKCTNVEECRAQAISIVKEFLEADSINEVNINYKCNDAIEKILNLDIPLADDVFKSIEEALLENLLDVIARFMRSSLYAEYKAQDEKKELPQRSSARRRMSLFFNFSAEKKNSDTLEVPIKSSRLSFKFWNFNK